MKRRLSFIILCAIILNLVMVANVFATDFSKSGTKLHTGWSPNWGTKSFNVDTSYYGNQYESNGYQYVDGHDFIVKINSSYNPEISRGAAQLQSLQLLNSGGTAVSTLYQSSFSPGLYRSFYLDPTAKYLCTQHSYSWLQSTAGRYRVKINTLYTNGDFSGMDGTDTYYSSYF